MNYENYYEDVENSAPVIEEKMGAKICRRDAAIIYFDRLGEKRILDVGCGPGFDAAYFANNGCEVHACDISKRAIEYAKKHNPGPKYFVWDIQKGPCKEKFNGIYAFEVVEHIFDCDAFLKNISQSLKPNGIFVATVPNVLSLQNRIKTLFGMDDWFRDMYHVHFFSKNILKKTLKANGFEILCINGMGKISFLGPKFAGSLFVVAGKQELNKTKT
jgi:2-polyprenyl-3-methyl-5-hydroxy-6-metoxy-1,4-benzoquinol methylase